MCCVNAFHCPLLSMSLSLALSSAVLFAVPAMNSCFANRICHCGFSCPFTVTFNISDPCRTPLLISVLYFVYFKHICKVPVITRMPGACVGLWWKMLHFVWVLGTLPAAPGVKGIGSHPCVQLSWWKALQVHAMACSMESIELGCELKLPSKYSGSISGRPFCDCWFGRAEVPVSAGQNGSGSNDDATSSPVRWLGSIRPELSMCYFPAGGEPTAAQAFL